VEGASGYLEEPPESEEPSESEEPREGAGDGDAPEAKADQGDAEEVDEPLLEGPTIRLLEYLKGLADELPPEKRDEFDVLGLKNKIDDLIGKINQEAERSREPPPTPPRERGFGLLSSGLALRDSDPRRSAEGRRAGTERRDDDNRRAELERRKAIERRASDERREGSNRRGGERRGPVPEIDLSKPIPKDAAPLKVGPDGNPTEIAGMVISPRMARLIKMMRQEKIDGR